VAEVRRWEESWRFGKEPGKQKLRSCGAQELARSSAPRKMLGRKKAADPMVRRARAFAESLFAACEDAVLFRTLATLRVDVPVFTSIDDLLWSGPT